MKILATMYQYLCCPVFLSVYTGCTSALLCVLYMTQLSDLCWSRSDTKQLRRVAVDRFIGLCFAHWMSSPRRINSL